MTDELLTTAEVAERLGVTDGHVRNMIRRGKLRAVRFGANTILIRAADLELVAERKRGRPFTDSPSKKALQMRRWRAKRKQK